MADRAFGPFSVSSEQITSLGKNFVPFVNALLRAEAAAAQMDGGQVTTTNAENIGDGGIDAGIKGAAKTRYFPLGDSKFQFKAGDLEPADCKEELLRLKKKSPSAALEAVRNGASYRLVLGADLTDDKVTRRREALEAAAASLGIKVLPGMFEVLQASDLADWAEQHPAVAVSRLLGGIGNVAIPLAQWAELDRLRAEWHASASRDELARVVDHFVTSTDYPDLRIEGVSGIGKTRAVLEALRNHSYADVVAYVGAYDQLPEGLLSQLQTQERTCVLVVDGCSALEHEALAGFVRVQSPVKLITIGQPTVYQGRRTPLMAEQLEDEALTKLIKSEQAGLSQEKVGFIVDNCAGNPRLAQILADALTQRPEATADDLITPQIINTYITDGLPTGAADLVACAAIALLPRVEHQPGSTEQLDELAAALDIPVTSFRMAIRQLSDLGMLTREGSSVSVNPQPLATHLARYCWDVLQDRILDRLLPSASEPVLAGLFQRAAELGAFEAGQKAVRNVLGPDGRLGTIGPDQPGATDLLLSHLAVLAPDEICERLEKVLEATADEHLAKLMDSWSGAEYALERLAWGSATFVRAANLLLRIARTLPVPHSDVQPSPRDRFVGLFGTILPATAATPAVRQGYLQQLQSSSDVRERCLAVAAAVRAVAPDELAFGSLRAQGRMAIESRGLPATWGDAWDYKASAIRVLSALATDTDTGVAEAAASGLADAVHPLLGFPILQSDLAPALARLPEEQLGPVRAKILELQGLYDDDQDGKIVEDLNTIAKSLPPASPEATVRFLAEVSRWELRDEQELQQRIRAALDEVDEARRVGLLLEILEQLPPASYEIGHVLGDIAAEDAAIETALARIAPDDQAGLVGYLEVVEAAQPGTFDRFLDKGAGAGMDSHSQVRISVRGPRSDAAWARVLTLATDLSAASSAPTLAFGRWELDEADLRHLVADWSQRIRTQDDYNAVVDSVSFLLYRRPPWIDAIDPLVAVLVAQRSHYPQLRQEEWDWDRLARRQLTTQPDVLIDAVIGLIESGRYRVRTRDLNEPNLLSSCAASHPDIWRRIMDSIAAGSTRLRDAAERQLGEAADVATAAGWIDSDSARATVVASLISLGGGKIGPVARFLITQFPDDAAVADALIASVFVSYWRGESPTLDAEIETFLNRLVGEPEELVRWARTTTDRLRERASAGLLEEYP